MTQPGECGPLEDVPLSLTPEGAAFLDSWRALQGGAAAVPCKSTFDPTRFRALLPHLVLYERRAPDDFHIRLIGTTVVERIGREATGDNVLDLIAPDSRAVMAATLNRVLDVPCGHAAVVEDAYPSGRRQQVEIVRLPLADEAGTPRFIVSLTQPLDVVGYAEERDRPELLADSLESRFFAL